MLLAVRAEIASCAQELHSPTPSMLLIRRNSGRDRFEANDFAEKIESLILNKHFYDKMRLNAWTYTRTQLTWDSIGNKIKKHIEL